MASSPLRRAAVNGRPRGLHRMENVQFDDRALSSSRNGGPPTVESALRLDIDNLEHNPIGLNQYRERKGFSNSLG